MENQLGLYGAIPFMGILLSLAFFPLLAPHFWHRHYGKVILAWALFFIVPSSLTDLLSTTRSIIHILMTDYIPFVLLVSALFVVSSGIRIQGSWSGSPWSNTRILLVGTFLASVIGTTGSSMVLIRPLMRANAWRRYQAHVFIFFIFLAANIGGALSPLGDPPLFLGFLKGVPFFWPLKNLLGPTLLVVGCTLLVFFGLDLFFFKREDLPSPHLGSKMPFKINGRINVLFLALIVLSVLLSGVVKTGVFFDLMGSKLSLENMFRDLSLIGIMVLSFRLTRKRIREDNHFSWDPLVEVSKVFLGIFITISPVLSLLQEGETGPFGGILSILNENGVPHNALYFWLSGLCSSFLDNAPTYLVFFFTAGGDVGALTTNLYKTLMAISLGSVYLGALTYIGNAPNFMIRSMVEQQGIKMPSFFVYLFISCFILIPIFFVFTYIYLI